MEIVRIVDARQMEAGATTRDRRRLVEQQPDAGSFETGDHCRCIMVAEHAKGRGRDVSAQVAHRGDRRIAGSDRLGAVVAGEDVHVIGRHVRQQLLDGVQGAAAVLDVQVAEMQDAKPVEGGGQVRQLDWVVPELHGVGVATSAPVKADRLQAGREDRGLAVPDVRLEVLGPQAEGLALHCGFPAEPGRQVMRSQAVRQRQDASMLVRRWRAGGGGGKEIHGGDGTMVGEARRSYRALT